jgi:hypothetical protein
LAGRQDSKITYCPVSILSYWRGARTPRPKNHNLSHWRLTRTTKS